MRNLGEDDPESPARAIARHRRTDLSADREGESWGRGAISMERDPQSASPAAGAVAAQRIECATATNSRDQADSFCLPLRRRALTMERPARSDMRLRKPCFLARRRLFGWYVRFTCDSFSWIEARGGPEEGVPGFGWVPVEQAIRLVCRASRPRHSISRRHRRRTFTSSQAVDDLGLSPPDTSNCGQSHRRSRSPGRRHQFAPANRGRVEAPVGT